MAQGSSMSLKVSVAVAVFGSFAIIAALGMQHLRISRDGGHPFQRIADSISDDRGHRFRLNADSVSA